MRKMFVSLVLLLAVSCSSEEVVVDTHGDKIDDHERRIALLEANDKLQDAMLKTHQNLIDALEKMASDSDDKINELKSDLDKAATKAADDLAAAIADLEAKIIAGDAQTVVTLMVEIEALQAALAANSALDDSRYAEITAELSALHQRITDEAAYSESERQAMKEEYHSKYRQLKQKIRNVKQVLSMRIANLRASFKSFKSETNGRLSALEDELFRVCEDRFLYLHEEECVDGVLARLDSLEEQVDENSDDISELQENLEDLAVVVFKNKKRSKENKQKIADLRADLEAAVSALEASDQAILSVLFATRDDLQDQIDDLEDDLYREKQARISWDIVLFSKIKSLKKSVLRLTNRISTIENNYVNHTDLVSALNVVITNIDQQITTINTTLGDHTTLITNLELDITNLQTQLDNIELTPGPKGDSGYNSLVKVIRTDLESCESGKGVFIYTGLDTNRSGVLWVPNEVTSTSFVCDGLNGTDGQSCSVEAAEGGAEITCGDSDPVFVAHGEDGEDESSVTFTTATFTVGNSCQGLGNGFSAQKRHSEPLSILVSQGPGCNQSTSIATGASVMLGNSLFTNNGNNELKVVTFSN